MRALQGPAITCYGNCGDIPYGSPCTKTKICKIGQLGCLYSDSKYCSHILMIGHLVFAFRQLANHN